MFNKLYLQHQAEGQLRLSVYPVHRPAMVGNKAGIFPQEQGTAHMIAQLVVIFLKGDTVRGNAVPEVMPFAYGVLQIEAE